MDFVNDTFLKALRKEILEKANKKKHMLIIACDDYEEKDFNVVGFFGADPVAMAYALVRIMEKEPELGAVLMAAMDAYKKFELNKHEN